MEPRTELSVAWRAALGLALLSVAALSDVLFASGDFVVSHREADTFFYFARFRRFAAAQILQGNLPLWNPHVFSGAPFLGDFQSALLYPPNVLYLLLPLRHALNLDVALHVFALGFFTFAWVRNRGVHGLAAFLAGVVMMFCGAVSLRVLAGQLTVLAAACWTPLVLLAVDRLLARPSLGWSLVGIAAFTLQVFAGYPFYVFATGVILALYVPLRLVRCPHRGAAVAALASLALAPPLLSAVQLWTGLATASETLRAGGAPFWFVASFSLPPESLLTALAPALFGDTPNTAYWGRWTYWDVGVFLGVTTLVLAAHGALRGKPSQRRFAPLLLGVMLLLALGRYTPLYAPLVEWVPGFDRFRAPSKFALQASLFVALLAAVGLDRWLRETRGARAAGVATALLAGALALAGAWLGGLAAADPAGVLRQLADAFASPERVPQADALSGLAVGAARALWIAAATAGAVALLLLLRQRARWVPYALAALACVELFAFASTHHDRFSLAEMRRPALEAFYRAHPGDYRVLDVPGRNHAMDAGALSVWGYDPVQLMRYGRFAASIQSGRILDPDYQLPIMVNLGRYHPRLDILRCRYVIEDWSLESPPREVEGGLPRLMLVAQYWRVPPEQALASLFHPYFDPRWMVLLEEEPEPRPTARGAEGTARIVDESTDHLTVEVDLPAPAILLITDAYSAGWRVIAESPLRILPANYVLRGIPLPAGQHRLRLEYSPAAYRIGARVSLGSLAVFAGAVVLWALRARARAAWSPGRPGREARS